MSLRSPFEQLADLRDDARLLIEQTGDQQAQLEALVASAESDVRQAEAALFQAGDVDEVRRNARVIAYTGNPSFDESPTRLLFAAVLHKPATPHAVLATVQQVAGL